MIRAALITFSVLSVGAHSAFAGPVELSQKELRASLAAGHSKPLGPILNMIDRQTDGSPIDVRAFDADGLIYSVLVLLSDGTMGFVFVDGQTGDFVSPRSKRAESVRALASKSAKQRRNSVLSAQNQTGRPSAATQSSDTDNERKPARPDRPTDLNTPANTGKPASPAHPASPARPENSAASSASSSAAPGASGDAPGHGQNAPALSVGEVAKPPPPAGEG